MMKASAHAVLLMWAALLWIGLAHAEGGTCPSGMYPANPGLTSGVNSCYPIPGLGNQQQTPQRPVEQWEDRWGAIAIDGKNGVLGTATGAGGEEAIERRAMADCQAQGGSACKLDLSYRNNCVAVITGDNTHNTGINPSLKIAIKKGLESCAEAGDKNCRTYYTNCSLPVRTR